ncbi:hypothetical protein CGRA01v4_05419 [Colletotrichum graminicola]|nr:hypothetical protein CGRA01v4_05419 [Colletotrichum graminicola]
MPSYGEDPCGRGKRWMVICGSPLLDLPERNPGQQRRSFTRFRSWSPSHSQGGAYWLGRDPTASYPGRPAYHSR